MSTANAETTGLQALERALWGGFIDGQFVPVGDDQPTFEVIEPSTARPLARVVDVTPDSRVGQEEIFGPVARIVRIRRPDEAFEIANGTSYGRRRSFLGSPFDGMKGSGFGRETRRRRCTSSCAPRPCGSAPAGRGACVATAWLTLAA